jgi:uncharacterized protein DUF4124
MNRAAIVFLLAAVLAAPASVLARNYRWVDDNGVVNYSDEPPRLAATTPTTSEPTPPRPGAARPHVDTEARIRSASVPVAPRPGAPVPAPGSVPSATARPDAITSLLGGLGLRRDAQRLAVAAQETAQYAIWREPARAGTWISAITRLSPERVSRAAEMRFRETGPAPGEIALVVVWLGTPLGGRVTAAMTEWPTPQWAAQFEQFMMQVPAAPPTEARLAAVRGLLRSFRFGPLGFDGSTLVTHRLRALVERAPQPQSVSLSLHLHRPETARRLLILEALFRTRALSDQELRLATQFWESKTARQVANSYREALVTAVVTATEPASRTALTSTGLVATRR